MIPEALLVGLNEISAVLLPILNYTLIPQLLCLRTSTAWLQLFLFTARERKRIDATVLKDDARGPTLVEISYTFG